jgi:hypothetical protein
VRTRGDGRSRPFGQARTKVPDTVIRDLLISALLIIIAFAPMALGAWVEAREHAAER